ncbi:protein translocase subunit SecF [Cohnella pontilimi]|uniref:Protein-export membrane protein SecF n=1 Tax=Cohnella pontilimi TaxID=2564100 RepID=A0A4U0FB60_9BACL|nr:protein translocase subunit SecF [Cohnella pontilimi]TJY41414.1 protein translocase subunit SecF [Cohnella pontilimi]
MRSEYDEKKFNFVKASKPFFIFSIAITLLGIIFLSIFGLNYGIDFRSGSSVDISISKPITQEQTEQFLSAHNFGEHTLTTAPNRLSIRFKDALSDQQEKQLRADFNEQLDDKASFEVNIVDPDIAREQQNNALIGMAVASLGIVAYITIRFEWRFAIAAVVSLLHDAFIVISLFSIFRLQVNLPFIVAVLTIIGYSTNDTVVIFDRIRENLRFAKVKTAADLAMLVNRSIWQTLTRSINTVITVALGALCLFIFGSESIKLFSLAMIFGLISGAYSSIFIASPLWLVLRRNSNGKKAAKASSAG